MRLYLILSVLICVNLCSIAEFRFYFFGTLFPISKESFDTIIEVSGCCTSRSNTLKESSQHQPHHCSIPHVYWISNTGDNNFGPITIVVVNGTNLLDQFHTYLPPVIKSTDKWTDISTTCLCRQKRLIRRSKASQYVLMPSSVNLFTAFKPFFN